MRSRINKRTTKPKSKSLPKFDFEIDYKIVAKTAVTILLYVILFLGISSIWNKSIAIKKFENSIDQFAQKNSETIFEIKEISFYISATAKQNEKTSGMDITTFTDISFNIDNPTRKDN